MSVKGKIIGLGLSASLIAGGAFGAYEYVHQSADALPAETPEGEPYTESYICFAEHPDCSRDVGALAILATGNQIKVPYSAISPNVINAVVATEDRRFWQHDGVDDEGIARAIAGGLIDSVAKKQLTLKQGASTIEMQLARNLYLASKPKDDLERKKWEWEIALLLDDTYSKQEILEKYLNTVYFGRGAYGVEAASIVYFGVEAKELDDIKSATLTAVLKGPDNYDGSDDPQRDITQRNNLLQRRNKVLGDMLEGGAISTEQYKSYIKVPLDSYVLPYRTLSVHDDYAVADYVGAHHAAQMIIDDVKKQTGYTDRQIREGLRINSTISIEAQASVVNAAKQAGDYPRDGRQIAVVALGKQGNILALYGGDYQKSQVNLVTSPSPAGSADKPWFYTNWLSTGAISSNQTFTEPPSFVWEGGGENGADYIVTTGDHCKDKQSCNLAEAIAVSSNMIPLQLAENIPNSISDTRALMEKFGIHSNTPDVPSNVLGSTEASPLNRTTAYAGLIANKGAALRGNFIVSSISKIDDKGNMQKLFVTQEMNSSQIVPVTVAEQMITFMRGVPRSGGTAGRKLNDIPTDIAGKTGTYDSNTAASIFLTACLVNPVTKQNEDITFGIVERYVETLAPLGKGQVGGNVPAAVYKQAVQTLLPEQSCQI